MGDGSSKDLTAKLMGLTVLPWQLPNRAGCHSFNGLRLVMDLRAGDSGGPRGRRSSLPALVQWCLSALVCSALPASVGTMIDKAN